MRARTRWVGVAAVASLALTICAGPALAGQGAQAGAAHPHTRPVNGFSAKGPWNTPLPANVPLAPNSAAIVANIAQDEQDTNGAWGLNTDTYSTPIFYVGRNTPVQNWTYSDCQNMPQLASVIAPSLKDVPTPKNLIVSQGTDESTTIYQPSTDTYWDFWRAQEDASGHWSACWGGVSTQANCFSWPANRDDGNTVGSDLPCEGQRFRLNPSFDVSTLYSPAAQAIARAMQQYGLIITDHGGAIVTYAQDPRPYEASHGGVNPYPALMDPDNLLGNLWPYVLSQIPVDELQALPLNYGERTR